jgi:hypothetical protein
MTNAVLASQEELGRRPCRKRELLWGAEKIGEYLNLKPRQVHHLAHIGAIKSLKKVGSKLVADVDALDREFSFPAGNSA